MSNPAYLASHDINRAKRFEIQLLNDYNFTIWSITPIIVEILNAKHEEANRMWCQGLLHILEWLNE